MRHPTAVAMLAVGLLLAGCGLLPNRSELNDHQAAPITLTDAQRWWKPLGDPLIDTLADDLVADNLDIQIALTRIDEARGLRRSTGSGLLPEIRAGGEAQRGNRQTAERASIAQGGFDASWELDLFGHVRAAVEGADAEIELATADADDVRNSMVAELVRLVVEWRQSQETVRVAKSLVEAQNEQITLIRSRTKAGLADASELERALAQRDQTATELPLALAASQNAELALERLLAKRPDGLKSILSFYANESLTLPTADAVLALPIDAVRNRPDMRAATASLARSNAALKQAEREVWPRVSLGAFFGGQSSTPGALVGENPLWSVVASATMPLLNFGRIYGAIDSADARAKRAELVYRNTSLLAAQETRSALSDYLHGLDATGKLKQSLAHRGTAVGLARTRFTNGLTDMTDLTTSQSELDQANLAYLRRKTETMLAFVRLHKALGTATFTPADPAAEALLESEPAAEVSTDPEDPNSPAFTQAR